MFGYKVKERKCLRCNSDMKLSEVNKGSEMMLYSTGLLFTKKTEADIMACPQCGYCELVARDPAIFNNKK